MDFSRAWEIARTVAPEYHHNKCSFNQCKGGMLCDCDVLFKHPEYEAEEKQAEVDEVVCSKESPCCKRFDEYNGFASGKLIFICPNSCTCHD